MANLSSVSEHPGMSGTTVDDTLPTNQDQIVQMLKKYVGKRQDTRLDGVDIDDFVSSLLDRLTARKDIQTGISFGLRRCESAQSKIEFSRRLRNIRKASTGSVDSASTTGSDAGATVPTRLSVGLPDHIRAEYKEIFNVIAGSSDDDAKIGLKQLAERLQLDHSALKLMHADSQIGMNSFIDLFNEDDLNLTPPCTSTSRFAQSLPAAIRAEYEDIFAALGGGAAESGGKISVEQVAQRLEMRYSTLRERNKASLMGMESFVDLFNARDLDLGPPQVEHKFPELTLSLPSSGELTLGIPQPMATPPRVSQLMRSNPSSTARPLKKRAPLAQRVKKTGSLATPGAHKPLASRKPRVRTIRKVSM